MSEELNICRIRYGENPILATEYVDGVSYVEALEAAFRKVEMAWEMKVRESERNDWIWTDFYETRDRVRREIVRLRRRITVLDRGGGRQNILRHAYLYRVDNLAEIEDELEIDEIIAQIKSLEATIKQKLIKAIKTERYECRQKFHNALDEYKEIITQYCLARIQRFDPDFTPDMPVVFKWKWISDTIAVYYGGDCRNIHENGHGYAEFSTENLRTIYLRPAFWEPGDWVIQKGRLRNMKLVEEERPKQCTESVVSKKRRCRNRSSGKTPKKSRSKSVARRHKFN